MSAKNTTEQHEAGEVFTRGVMRMMAMVMPGSGASTEVEIIEAIPLDRIDPSPLNRVEFDKAKMSELVESLREHGQTTPAIVRPKADGRLELVAGERRWRACGVADIPTLNCVVRSYSDTQAAEILLIENLEREDLKPTEEASIYKRLLELTDEHGAKLYTLERIAERVHNDAKKVDRVARVLTILNLPKPVKKALDAGEIGVHVAFQIARIADSEDREKAGEVVLKGQYGEGPMTKEKARDYISREFQVNLKGAKFDRNDANILSDEQKADLGFDGKPGCDNDGSCERCQWLARNHPIYKHELADGGHGKKGKVGIDPLTCTRAKCHEAKLDAVWMREAEEFAKKHEAVRVLTRRESETVRNFRAPWVLVDERPSVEDTGDWEAAKSAPTWEKLIKGGGVPLVVAREMEGWENGGGPMLVVDRTLAVEAARKVRPELFAKAKVAGQTGAKVVLSDQELEAQRKADYERKLENAVDERMKRVVLEELMESIGSNGLALEGYRGLFDSISRNVERLGALAGMVMPNYSVVDESEWPEKEMGEYFSALNADGMLALCVAATVLDDVLYSGPDHAADFLTIAAAQGLDIKAIKKRVEKDVKRKLDAEAKAAKVAAEEDVQRKNRNAMEEIQKRTVMEESEVEPTKQRCREWRAANPGKGFQAMADEVGISVDEAFRIGDELIDEEYAQKKVEEIEARPSSNPKALPDAEKAAWESYLATGSIAAAAEAAGVAVDTVKNWHKRRKWKALRAAEVGQ
jgi:ParB/RepB/Spo0J family partition protein